MKRTKTYRFAVHSPHFLCPVYIKHEVDEAQDSFAAILDQVSKDAVIKWVQDFPQFFDNVEASKFYDTLSILVSQEV